MSKVTALETYHLKKNIEELHQELEVLRKKTLLLEHESTVLKKQNIHYQFLEQLLTLIPEHIYWKNNESVYLGCNDKFAQMFGFSSRDQVIGKSEYELNNGANAIDTIAHDQIVIKSKKATFIEEAALNSKDEKKYFLSHKVPVCDPQGNVIGLIGISFDITERKKIETDLKLAQENAQAANQLKTQIIRNFSHDIRTPLSGIISMAEILADRTPHIAEDLIDIKNAGQQLLNLLSDIIAVSQLELNELPDTQEKFLLQTLVTETAALFKPAIREKGLSFSLTYDDTIPKYLLGNASFIQKILLNLIGNAVKFTKKGSIDVAVDCLRKEDGKLLIQLIVQDTGIGIPENMQTWIFEPFNRLTPTYEEQYKGSGLGLHIVSEFIRKLGGEIYVKSTLGKGSTFKCLIPLKRPLMEEADDFCTDFSPSSLSVKKSKQVRYSKSTSPVAPAHPLIGTKKILLVEDNLLAQKTAVINLKQWGYHVTTANDGKTAINLSQREVFDLIYMDIGLPDQDGCYIAQQIRDDKKNPNHQTPIVALTAHADEQIDANCYKAGMQAVLNKPLAEHQAREIAEKFLNKNLPIIDLDLGAKILSSDKNAAKEMLNLLIHEQLPKDLKEIETAYAAGDNEELEKAVHRLHGGLCYCGAPRLKEAAKILEVALRTKELTINKNYLTMQNEISLLMQEWKNLSM